MTSVSLLPEPLGAPSTPRRSSIHNLPPGNVTPTRTPTHKRSMTSVQVFQERHAMEFAHLHNHRDSGEKQRRLEMENASLDEARRIGRAKRQTLAFASASALPSGSRMGGPVEEMELKGRRPLSLLTRRQVVRPTTLVQPARHRHSQTTDIVTPSDLSTPSLPDLHRLHSPLSPLVADTHSPDPDALVTPNQAGLAMGSAPLPTRDPKTRLPSLSSPSSSTSPTTDPDQSLQSSTYSWASSFSGETIELRTAAHYVPDAPTSDKGEEEVLDSPEKTQRRRKRIVALAHTVRQLEGVGSRDVEDPTFYHVLVKAWNERPGYNYHPQPVWEHGQSNQTNPYPNPNPNYTAPPSILRRASDPVTANVNVSAPALWLGPPPLSTPALDSLESYGSDLGQIQLQRQEDHNHERASPTPSSHLAHDPSLSASGSDSFGRSSGSSNPFRYSYASTIHDLALDGGLQLGNKLMSEKAWLRSPLFDQGTYFDAHTPSAPFPTTFAQAPRPPSPSPSAGYDQREEWGRLSTCSSDSDRGVGPSIRRIPERVIRRQHADISQAKAPAAVLGTPIDLPDGARRPSDSSATNWGLGFIGNWLPSERAPAPGHIQHDLQYSDASQRSQGPQDFQIGEDGKEAFIIPVAMAGAAAEGKTDPSTFAHLEGTKTLSAEKSTREEIDNDNDSTQGSIEVVLPSPEATNMSRHIVHPPCVEATEYQYSTPCRRQSYSTPSIISYPRRLELELELQPQPQPQREGEGRKSLSAVSAMITTTMTMTTLEMDMDAPRPELREYEAQTMCRSLSAPQRQQSQARGAPLGLAASSASLEICSYPSTSISLPRPPHQLQLQQTPNQPTLPFIPTTPKVPHRNARLEHNTPSTIQHPKLDLDSSARPMTKPKPNSPIGTADSRSSRTNRHLNSDPCSYPRERSTALQAPYNLNLNNNDNDSADDSTDADNELPPTPSSTIVPPAFLRAGDIEMAQPQPRARPQERKRNLSLWLFLLGFVIPGMWALAGWPFASSSSATSATSDENSVGQLDQQQGQAHEPKQTTKSKSEVGIRRLFFHPDPYVRASRIATVVSAPLLIGAVIAIIVAFTVR